MNYNQFSSSSTLPTVINSTTTIRTDLGGYESKFIHDTVLLWNGLSRLHSLVSTVAVICYDYVKIMRQNKNVIRKSDPLREKIRLLRLEHEKLGLQYYHSTDSIERENLQIQIKGIVSQLKASSVSNSEIVFQIH